MYFSRENRAKSRSLKLAFPRTLFSDIRQPILACISMHGAKGTLYLRNNNKNSVPGKPVDMVVINKESTALSPIVYQ